MRKAKWIRRTHLFGQDEYVCSYCRHVSSKAYNCCPFCGCVMGRMKSDSVWIDELESITAILDDDW